MTKKITISVPDDLHEKMETRKKQFNFSKIFQNAITESIKKQAEFNARLNEAVSDNQVIKRLKKEKRAFENIIYDKGEMDGIEFAKTASYDDLHYVANSYEPIGDFQSPGFIQSNYPTNNDTIGMYFEDVMIEDERLLTGSVWAEWEEGWLKGVQGFWDEIQAKLED